MDLRRYKKIVHYNDFTTFDKRSDMVKWEIAQYSVSPVFHSCNMITSL